MVATWEAKEMARPSGKTDLDLSKPYDLTLGVIDRLRCPEGKQQAFLRDAKSTGLRVRVTASGVKAYVFESKLRGGTFRRTIGNVKGWTIEQARAEANRLRVVVDKGEDPRELEKQAEAARRAAEAAEQEQSLKVGDVWPRYLTEGKPKRKDAWKPGYLADMVEMSKPGGETKKRGQGLTRKGVIYPLLSMALQDVNEDTLKVWFDAASLAATKHQAARGLMMFRGFLRWCSIQPDLKKLVDRDAGKSEAILDNLPKNTKRSDALDANQVKGWWLGVEQIGNPTASIYLRALLLTGARRQEIAALRWDDVDFRWGKLTIADKVDKTRTIPLGPYLAQLLGGLQRKSPYVFATTGQGRAESKSGYISDTRRSHGRALEAAGIKTLTIHGLRRSFALMGESAGAPAGAIAQIMGHKPSATAEGYKPRTMDALRPYLEQIEAHILRLAGVKWDEKATPGKLRAVV
jgi:integrase